MALTSKDPVRYWLVIPAAGVGTRFAAAVPKQYLLLEGRPVICHTLERLRQVPGLSGGVVVLASDDRWWPGLDGVDKAWWRTVAGGAERADSVLSGLESLVGQADDCDWVLVHDVARPCIRPTDVLRLMDELRDAPDGGLLATPLADTVKQVNVATRDFPEVVATLDRDRLWAAQTPQMFRLGVLRDALRAAADQGVVVTDEASAIEWQGLRPRLVTGRPDNIKITRPDDLALAAAILHAQGDSAAEAAP